MQFWQSSRKKNARNTLGIQSMFQIYEKINNFFEKILFENFFLNRYNAVLLTPIENLLHKTEKCLVHVRICRNFFWKISLSPNFSGGHLESRFHKTSGKVSTEKVPLNKTIWWKGKKILGQKTSENAVKDT